ncbi:MAG: hypothetical protein PHS49_01810 [Candidatus Gracilibacteria bacterium]|nr:hypothetical protein [Candidatus Gracilibacteria bacterium]
MNLINQIDNNFELEGNGEKVTELTSLLVKFTQECCFNCLNGEKNENNDYYSFVQCQNPNSNYKGLDNSSQLLCEKYEG